MSEKKMPVEGETVIAVINGRDKEGNTEKRTVYYGNIVTTEGKKGKHKVKAVQYEELLNDFFKSERGHEYLDSRGTISSQQDEVISDKTEPAEKEFGPEDISPEITSQETEPAENRQEAQDESVSMKSGKTSPWLIVTAVAAILSVIFSGMTAYQSFIIYHQDESETAKEYQVIKVTENIPAGTVITEEMLSAETVTEEDYQALFTNKQIIRADGSTISEKPLLWSNKNQAVGTYALDTMNAGSYLLNSGYSILREGEALVEMNIDGTTVKVPVTTVTNGSSTIRLYAIVTSSDADGNKKTYPMDLGEFKLEGKTLKDIINSEGKSILQEFIKEEK